MWPPDGWRNGKTADALPAAGKARRFLGCVLTGGHKCDGQSDDTTRAAQPSRRRGSLAALSAATRTRAPKRATGTFFSLRSCPVRASARVIPKRNTILLDGVSFCACSQVLLCLQPAVCDRYPRIFLLKVAENLLHRNSMLS